jgi:glucokinase
MMTAMKLGVDQMACLESEILKEVRAHPGISRVELARELQIAPSTVGNYVGRLITEGFLLESKGAESEPGRPRTALRLRPEGGQFIGVDFEARNILAMAVDFSDRPLRQARRQIQKADSVADIIRKIEEAIAEVLPATRGRLLAIGVGVPGLIDPAAGVALNYKYINQWRNVPLVAPLAKRFGVPVHIENNVRSMALAELWFGLGRGFKDWFCLGIRSGIGAGIVAGGQLLRGADHRAGEIGRWFCPASPHLAAHFFTPQDMAAGNLELQEVASVRAMLAAAEQARAAGKTTLAEPGKSIVFDDLVRAAQQDDETTLQIVGFAAEMLGWAVADLALVLNPSRVIIAGPLTLLGDHLLVPLRKRAGEIMLASGAEAPLILNSTMGEFSGAMGAAALAVHEWKPAH